MNATAKSSRKRPPARPLPIESGMVENCAQRPYNRLERAFLRVLGMALGRQIV